VKLAAVSQNAVQSLIELESEIITSALTAAAMRLERAAQAEGVVRPGPRPGRDAGRDS